MLASLILEDEKRDFLSLYIVLIPKNIKQVCNDNSKCEGPIMAIASLRQKVGRSFAGN